MRPPAFRRFVETDAVSLPLQRRFPAILSAGFVFSAAINLLLLSVPLYSLQIFTRAIPSGNRDTLIALTVIVVLALTIMALLEVVRTHLFSRAANILEVAYRPSLVGEAAEAAARGQPQSMPLTDLAEVKGFIARPTFAALNDLPWTPLYVVVIYLIHPALAAIMLVGGLALVAMGMIGDKLTAGLGDRARLPGGRAARLFDTVMGRFETVRALRMQPAALERLNRDSLSAAALAGIGAERSAAIGAASKWVRYLVQIAGTAVGAALVMDNHLTFGGMIATSMLVGRGMAPIEQLAGAWGSTIKSLQAWRRLGPYLKRLDARTPANTVTAPRGPVRLAAENVLYVLPREQRPVIRSVSLAVEPGELLCIVGPNRCGKTTLAKLLAGGLLPTAGAIRLNGVALAALASADPRGAVGYMPQSNDLLPGTIADNIGRFLSNAREGVVEAARLAGIHELIEALPQGYDTDIAEAQALFTGGTERLIALARAAFGRPPLLVLDEPAANLDGHGCALLRKFLVETRQRGIGIVVLSHNGVFVDLADRTLMMNQGMVVAVGPREVKGKEPQAAGGKEPQAAGGKEPQAVGGKEPQAAGAPARMVRTLPAAPA